MPKTAVAPEIRFARFVKREEGGCWVWTGSRNASGYGFFGLGRSARGVLAHRFSFAMVNGPIPPKMCVLHKCDNPPCVNPDHLWLGTQAQNMADKIAKGRQRVGAKDRHRLSKITREVAAQIRHERASGKLVKHIAKDRGLCVQTVSDILNGRHWTCHD